MDKARPRRQSIRLKGYDYSQAGAYFVTICSHQRISLFGDIADNHMRLNEAGFAVAACWRDIPDHYPSVSLDEWIIMPNHLHGIVILTDVGARHASPLRGTRIGTVVGSFKSAAAKRINDLRATLGAPVWQRNYYEHVVRNESTLNHIRQYIVDNPARWADDPDNPIIWQDR